MARYKVNGRRESILDIDEIGGLRYVKIHGLVNNPNAKIGDTLKFEELSQPIKYRKEISLLPVKFIKLRNGLMHIIFLKMSPTHGTLHLNK